MDEQELAREAVKQARRDEMKQAPGSAVVCLLCGRPYGAGGWTHGVGTKWGDACISTEQAS